MMSAYPGPGNSYPPNPPANSHPHPLPIQVQTGGQYGHHDPLSAHHGLPAAQSPYQYDHQSASQLQLPYNGHPNGHGHADAAQQVAPTSVPSPPARASGEGQKGNRLRKACDSCSIRKVKCDESGPPCRACAALDIPCTFNRQSKRRGPPNRHAEAIKKRKLEEQSPGGAGLFSAPTSPNNVAETLASFSSHAVLNAESICPFETLELLVDDYFTYIHPLCPFPHEPSFRGAFRTREDLKNPQFLALLASMIGVLVASFPRKPRLHLKAQRREYLFPNSISFVDRCHKVAVEARGPGYLDKKLTVYDAVTSYLLGLAGAYTFRWKQTRLYFGETLTIIRVLGAHKLKNPGILSIGALPATFGGGAYGGDNNFDTQPPVLDHIQQEIGRRVFWVMFMSVGSIQQLGSNFGELLMPPPTPSDPYPPLPAEVDDDYIYVDRIDSQPAGFVSKITGFNLNVKVYLTLNSLSTMELAYGIDEVFDWDRQKRVLEECLRGVKHVLDNAPAELLLQAGSRPGEFGASSGAQYYPPAAEYPGLRSNEKEANEWQLIHSDARRQLQYEVQKANIYASQLGTRSYIVEKYCNLQEAHENMNANARGDSQISSPGVMARGLDGMLPKASTSNYNATETNVSVERESIVRDLLQVLSSISQVNMEPNGGSFINKIRQIASTLIDTPQNRKGPYAVKAEEYLSKFLDVLMKLERTSPGTRSDSAEGAVDEEEELRSWADLREYQMKFAQAGGFLSEI